MITPAFSLTATERVLPKLALDFTTASLDPRITFTRTTGASNPATYVNNGGAVTAATNNQPRFDYDPVTLVCKGLLIEESRSNSLIYSDQFNDATWVKTNASISADAAVSPDGTSNADALSKSAAFGSIYQGLTIATGTYTASVYMKAGTRTTGAFAVTENGSTTVLARANINLSTGVVTNNTGTVFAVAAGNGWYRVYTTVTTTNTSVRVFIYSGTYNGSETGDVYAWGAQLEAGAFATSYIPTTTAALTRNADVATMTGTNFSDWFNASEGTFVAEGSYSTNSANCLYVNDGTTSNRLMLYMGNSAQGLITTAGVAQASLDGGTPIVGGALNKVCLSYKANNFGLALQGGATVTDTSGTVPTVSQLNIGAGPALQQPLNGVITGFEYYPQRLTNAEIQAFSKG